MTHIFIKDRLKCVLYRGSYKMQNVNIVKICEDNSFIDIDI